MVRKFRVTMEEHDRWSGQDYWYEYFDTKEEAQERILSNNAKNNLREVPDYYVVARNLVEVKQEMQLVDKIVKLVI